MDAPEMGREPGMLDEWRRLGSADRAVNGYRTDRAVLAVWRLGQVAHARPGRRAFVVRRLHSLLDAVFVRAVVGAELPRSAMAGPGIRLPHSGRGVVLHPAARLGSGVTLYHRVTLGVRGSSRPPVIGDGAYLGVGAAVIGAVRVGDGATVGANAVVLKDVPDGDVAVGVPSRLLGRTRS